MGGNFNNVLKPGEREGGQEPLEAEFEPFTDCLCDCSLEVMRGKGRFFTWTNKTIRSKIDRILINPKWMETFPEMETFYTSEQLSDHTRILFQFTKDSRKRKSCFWFCNMWCLNPAFISIVH